MRTLFGLAIVVSLAAPTLAAEKTIVETAASNPQFSTLVAAVKAADLAGALSGPGPLTVLAPTDEAFGKLPAGTVEELLKPENKAKLAAILKYHVIPGRATAAQVVTFDGRSLKTLEGSAAPVSVQGQTVRVGDARVTQTDILCSNGVIHVIDTVLIPSAK